jgi:diaminohydroxyphosphoribosylaminopyrimidine deaminase/5-amino-6-(5-phosphoribosylamino)uracil reductase
MIGGRNPARIILDSNLRIPLHARALDCAKTEKVIIATSERRDRKKERQLKKLGAAVLVCGKDEVNLRRLVAALPKMGIISVLIEGGAETIKSAIREKIADKAIICVSSKKLKSPCPVYSPWTNAEIRKLKKRKIRKIGADTLIEGYF